MRETQGEKHRERNTGRETQGENSLKQRKGEEKERKKTERDQKDRERPETGADIVATNVAAATVLKPGVTSSAFEEVKERKRETEKEEMLRHQDARELI